MPCLCHSVDTLLCPDATYLLMGAYCSNVIDSRGTQEKKKIRHLFGALKNRLRNDHGF